MVFCLINHQVIWPWWTWSLDMVMVLRCVLTKHRCTVSKRFTSHYENIRLCLDLDNSNWQNIHHVKFLIKQTMMRTNVIKKVHASLLIVWFYNEIQNCLYAV